MPLGALKTRVMIIQVNYSRITVLKELGPLGKVAELGVLRGLYSGNILKAGPDELHLIDPWRTFPSTVYNDYPKKGAKEWEDTYQYVRRRFVSDPRVSFHRTTSVEGLDKFPDGYFDLIYIDANHAYEFVYADIKAALKKTAPGGIVMGHDYEEGNPGVIQAVSEHFGTARVFITTESTNARNQSFARSWIYFKDQSRYL